MLGCLELGHSSLAPQIACILHVSYISSSIKIKADNSESASFTFSGIFPIGVEYAWVL